MDVSIATLKKIFEPDRRHVVPMFQRPDLSGPEALWKPLWDAETRDERQASPAPSCLTLLVPSLL